MAAQLVRAAMARRLSPGTRGLADALGDASSSSGRLAGQQLPWPLAAVRSHSAASGAASASAERGFAASSQHPDQPAQVSGDSSSSEAQAQAQAAAAEAVRARPPPGHTDFEQRQLLMLFTCTKCDTRAAKAFSKQAYETGVVIVDCPGCQNKHLIADHLGWFGHKGTVEEFAAERGGTVMRRLADGTLELSPQDVLGAPLAEAAQAAAAGQATPPGGGVRRAPA